MKHLQTINVIVKFILRTQLTMYTTQPSNNGKNKKVYEI